MTTLGPGFRPDTCNKVQVILMVLMSAKTPVREADKREPDTIEYCRCFDGSKDGVCSFSLGENRSEKQSLTLKVGFFSRLDREVSSEGNVGIPHLL